MSNTAAVILGLACYLGSTLPWIALARIVDAAPGNDYCNGNIASTAPCNTGACICDCLHADDLAALLKEKGLDKRIANGPAAK